VREAARKVALSIQEKGGLVRKLISNTFARAWETAEVVYVPKDGRTKLVKKQNKNSNRPISLLPVRSKVNDSNNLLTSWMLISGYQISKQQSKYYSIETALLHVTDELLNAVDEKNVSRLFLLDISCWWNFVALVCHLAWPEGV